MKLLEKILLAVDFVDQDNKDLVNAAIYLSRIFNSKIVAINVIPRKTDNDSVMKYLRKFANEEMEKLSNTLEKADVRYKTRIVEGNPVEQIIETAERGDFNTILMGPGNAAEETRRPGITVRKLIRKTNVPVWVIKENVANGFENILCPIDFSDSSRRALTNAVLFSAKMKTNLRIISVFEPVEVVSGRFSDDLDEHNEKSFASYKKQFDNFIKEFNLSRINYSTKVLRGKPEYEILEELKSGNFDLLLMGTKGRTGFSRILIGSVTENVIEECHVSYITTKKKDILNPEFEIKISQLENLLEKAEKNMEKGNYEKAANLYLKCLEIDGFLLPAIKGTSRAYEKAGKSDKAKRYHQFGNEIEKRLWKR